MLNVTSKIAYLLDFPKKILIIILLLFTVTENDLTNMEFTLVLTPLAKHLFDIVTGYELMSMCTLTLSFLVLSVNTEVSRNTIYKII